MASSEIAIDPPSRRFHPILVGLGAWTDHLHFGYDAVAALRPRTLVELGTDRGESYFCFCQAVVENNTGTHCFAVDNWRGDLHVGGYDEATYHQVARHNEENYSDFSTLVRSDFDEALGRFEENSIDLLHLDGLHTEAAVRQDLARWLPKLRPSGILLVHDVAVRKRGFGVWKVWEELCTRGRSFTFADGPGLGLWEKPPAATQPAPIETFLSGPNEQTEQLLSDYRIQSANVHQRIARSWSNGTISDTYFAQQTTIQVFFSTDGVHREENSVLARIGHGEFRDLTLPLPPGGHRAVRIDFVSAFTTIDLEAIRLRLADGSVLFEASTPETFGAMRITGDALRLSHPTCLRIKVTGIDPQIYLPQLLSDVQANESVSVQLHLRVHPTTAIPP